MTRPERCAARGEAAGIAARIRADGGCAHCLHRARWFETTGRLAACGLDPPRRFPDCVGEDFVFDDTTI